MVDSRDNDEARPNIDPTRLGHERTLEATAAAPRVAPSPARLATLTAGLPRVGRAAYTVGQEVAQGGIGRVLRAHDERLDRPVAIKELLLWNERQERRFVREALLTARLQHPAIVPIYEAGRWPDGEPFYAMKLVSGRSLADLIGEREDFARRLSLLPHVLAVAQAIAYAHSQRILHRDLKPANVLVGEFGETVVIDWGLAKDLADDDSVAEEPAARVGEGLSIAGAVVGTPAYMPPERAAGAAVDERADVYALGAVLYHVLAAVPPYDDTPSERLLPTIAAGSPRPLEQLVPELSEDLAAIVRKAMARDPADRYPSARELADDLERFQTGRIVAAHTYSAGQLLRRYWLRHRAALSVAVAALALLSVVVVAGFVDVNRERSYARVQEREAIDARGLAERASAEATARADAMTLLQAQGAIDRDPNRALAWLKTLSPGFDDATTVRRIAADAHAHGISRAFHGHTEYVNRMGLAPDGRRFVTSSDDKTARVWDLTTGASLLLAGHSDEVWNARFISDDEVATASKDGTLRIWDARTGAPRAVIPVPAPTRQLVARPDGALLGGISSGAAWLRRPGATSVERLSADRPRWVFIAADGQHLIVQPERGDTHVRDLVDASERPLPGTAETSGRWFLDAHATVALHLSEKTSTLWELATMTRRELAVASPTRRPAFTSRGDMVAFAVGADIHVYDTRSGALVRALVGHEGPVQAILFAGDDRRLISGGVDRTVRRWDLGSRQTEVHAGFEGLVTEVELLADGRSIVAASSAGEVRVFEPRRAGQVLTDHAAPTTGLALAADDRIASIDDQGRLYIGDLDGAAIAEHPVPRASDYHLVAAPDGRSFAGAPRAWIVAVDGRTPDAKASPGVLLFADFDATAPRTVELAAALLDLVWLADGGAVVVALVDGTVRRIDLAGETTTLARLAAPATSVAVSPDGASIAAGGEDGSVRLIESATGLHRELQPHKERVTALAFAAGGAWLASGSADHTIRLWRLADGSFRSFDEGGHGVEQAEFSVDGETLILLSGGETQLRRLSVASGEHLAPLAGRLGKLHAFTLAADGRRLLALGEDGAARLIDMADGEGRTLAGHREAVMGAGFAAGGSVLVTLGREGTVRAWPDDLPATMPELRAWIDAATPERIRGQ